jgi:hypothetical protein
MPRTASPGTPIGAAEEFIERSILGTFGPNPNTVALAIVSTKYEPRGETCVSDDTH